MDELQKKYHNLRRRILRGQARLKRKEPSNDLLEMLEIDEIGIHWTKKFGVRYLERTTEEGLNQYVNDLEKITSK